MGQLSVSVIIIYQLCDRVTAFSRHNTGLSCPPTAATVTSLPRRLNLLICEVSGLVALI